LGKGLFVVLEGSYGSNVATQLNLLKERLKAMGYEVALINFPQLNHKSSVFVKNYVAGQYGQPDEVSPYTAALFFALDHYGAAKDISEALNSGKIVLSSGFVGSTMAQLGARFTNPVEQRGFFVWADNLEYQMLNLPRPDINLYLRVPARIAKNAAKTEDQANLSKNLKQAVATYDLLCKLFPKDFNAIDGSRDGRLLGIAAVSDLIWQKIKPLLPADKPHPSHRAVVTLDPAAENYASRHQPANGHLYVPFKSSSLLLRMSIERYLPGSTGRIEDWSASLFDFYTPQGFDRELANNYKDIMVAIADNYQILQRRLIEYKERNILSDDARSESVSQMMRPLTPLAALTSFELTVKKKDVHGLAAYLLAADSAELQWAAKQIYLAARQHWPENFNQPLESDSKAENANSFITSLAEQRVAGRSSERDSASLLEVSPRREFDILAESVYPFSELSLAEITEKVTEWPYQQKYSALRQAVDQPGLLDKVRYKMDIISDQVTLKDMIKIAGLREVQAQAASPRFGFEVPVLIEEARLDDAYNQIFDDSLKLHSLVQSAGQDATAEYATLLGHKTRWQLSATAGQLQYALTVRGGEDYNRLADSIIEKLIEVHPLLWEVITGKPALINPSINRGKNRIKPYHQRKPRRPRPLK
jgi:dTMP kinase